MSFRPNLSEQYLRPDGRLTIDGQKLLQSMFDRILVAEGEIDTLQAQPAGMSEYLVPIWAEENAVLGNNTYEWAFGNGADTPSNAGITIYVPSGMECHIVAMTGTTNSASGTSVIEANVNGSVLGVSDGVEVTLSGRSGANDAFTDYALSTGDRLTFRTRTAGTNAQPSTVTAWLRYRQT